MPPLGVQLESGAMLGPHRLLFRLGRGGMGEVWAAEQLGELGLSRLVAIKVIRSLSAEQNEVLMFLDEARVSSALQHPAVVQTYDVGREEGAYFIAMALVRGPSLASLLQRMAAAHLLPSPAIVAYVGQRLSSALDYAHERAELGGQRLRLIHRDVSPHNVMIDEEGHAMLMDFGVARTSVQAHYSVLGTLRGKPSYMAPEQLSSGHIDGRTDIFSLGIVLHEFARMRRLFGRKNPLASMRAIVEDEAPLLHREVPEFPEALSRVVDRCLAKDPARRFQSAAEVVTAFTEAGRGAVDLSAGPRELAALVRTLFPAGAFDVAARVREAVVPVSLSGEISDTLSDKGSSGSHTVVDAIATGPWGDGGAYEDHDPLDPEAIDAPAPRIGAMDVPAGAIAPLNALVIEQSSGLGSETAEQRQRPLIRAVYRRATPARSPRIGTRTAMLFSFGISALISTAVVLEFNRRPVVPEAAVGTAPALPDAPVSIAPLARGSANEISAIVRPPAARTSTAPSPPRAALKADGPTAAPQDQRPRTSSRPVTPSTRKAPGALLMRSDDL